MSNLKLTGIVITPKSKQYKKAKTNYNLSIPKNPCLIVFCLEEQDVINAIKYAKYNHIDFRIRSGIHDFEANSNIDYGLVIDMSKINYVKIDKKNSTATVGGVGYATRYLGLTCDNLIEVTMINNNGEKLIVNENNNKDLFWAIKGAPASSFGIITSLKYKVHKSSKVCFLLQSGIKKIM